MQVFKCSARNLCYVEGYVINEETTFTFASLWVRAVQLDSPSDSWAPVLSDNKALHETPII